MLGFAVSTIVPVLFLLYLAYRFGSYSGPGPWCKKCGYSLYQSRDDFSATCPECGTATKAENVQHPKSTRDISIGASFFLILALQLPLWQGYLMQRAELLPLVYERNVTVKGMYTIQSTKYVVTINGHGQRITNSNLIYIARNSVVCDSARVLVQWESNQLIELETHLSGVNWQSSASRNGSDAVVIGLTETISSTVSDESGLSATSSYLIGREITDVLERINDDGFDNFDFSARDGNFAVVSDNVRTYPSRQLVFAALATSIPSWTALAVFIRRAWRTRRTVAKCALSQNVGQDMNRLNEATEDE